MATWLRNPLAVLAEGAEGGIVINDDGRIGELVPAGERPHTPNVSVFEADQHVIIPGLVNTHHHFFQTLTRAFPPALDKELFPWLRSLYPYWEHLDGEMVSAASRLAMAELLLSGCTTAADHHYVFTPSLRDTVDREAEAARELGIRGVFSRGAIDLVEGNDVTPPRMIEPRQQILDHTEALLKSQHESGPGAQIQVAVAPCTPVQVTRELMQESASLARRFGAPLHMHLAETRDEVALVQQRHGQRTVSFLEDLGWLASDVWVAHGIHFEDEEVKRLGQAGTGVSHCPSSNAILASGGCRVTELEEAGCCVGLGVDGSASNDHSNLIQEVRQAFLAQRLRYGAEAVRHGDALRWATEGSAACLGRDDIGRIEPGKQADLALFRLDEPRFAGYGDPLAALVICGAHRADRVMVGGEWVVAGGELVHADIAEIMARHRAASARMQDVLR